MIRQYTVNLPNPQPHASLPNPSGPFITHFARITEPNGERWSGPVPASAEGPWVGTVNEVSRANLCYRRLSFVSRHHHCPPAPYSLLRCPSGGPRGPGGEEPEGSDCKEWRDTTGGRGPAHYVHRSPLLPPVSSPSPSTHHGPLLTVVSHLRPKASGDE